MTDADVLQAEIARRTSQGWMIVSSGPTQAQMKKPKSFSFGWALLWFLLLGIGLLVYIFYYMAKKEPLIYIQVTDGQLSVTES